MHLLLQILEEGKIADSLGEKIDFRNTIIIMTSNAGAELIKRHTAMGFGAIADHDHTKRLGAAIESGGRQPNALTADLPSTRQKTPALGLSFHLRSSANTLRI
jgi:AAA domain (Cdc48 subfamily)